jgi:hypothetical protein
MKNAFFYLAILGWLVSIAIHVLAIFDQIGDSDAIFLMHLGVFVVWLPAILSLRAEQKEKNEGQATRQIPLSLFIDIFKRIPLPIAILAIAGFVYALINFVLFMTTNAVNGTPTHIGDIYMLQNRGEQVKILTAQEYLHLKSAVVRGFSGHWIAFYGLAVAFLYPYPKADQA